MYSAPFYCVGYQTVISPNVTTIFVDFMSLNLRGFLTCTHVEIHKLRISSSCLFEFVKILIFMISKHDIDSIK